MNSGAEDVTEIGADASESGSPEIMVRRSLVLGVEPVHPNMMPDKNTSEPTGYHGFQGFGAHVTQCGACVCSHRRG